MRSLPILVVTVALLGCATNNSTGAAPAAEAMSPDAAQAVALIRGLAGGDFAAVSGAFSPDVMVQYSVGRLRETWQQVTGQYGDLASVGEPVQSTQQGYDVYIIPLKFTRGTLHARVVFGPQGAAGLFFVP